MQWGLITDVILVSSIITLALFAVLGLVQWISRKSFIKIDKQIRWMLLPLSLMAIVYFVFDKLWVINVRPNGSGESSFPSTHVMVVATIFFITAIALPKYVKSKTAWIFFVVIMLVLICLTAIGRVFANMHYPIDVAGGVLFAFIFGEIYLIALNSRKLNSKKGPKNKHA